MKKEQTKNQQEKNQKKSQKLQWHPAFCSALRLELLEDAENLEFTDEFQLTEKPLQIDCTVVKVKRDCKIKNEIGKIFRKHNIFGDNLVSRSYGRFSKISIATCITLSPPVG